MNGSSSLTLKEQVPLYVRWNPDRSPHAVELRLDLVAQISGELAQAQRIGIEIGGLLLGTLPSIESPTLRIDDVVLIGRRFEDGAIYMLEPGQQQRFAEIREEARKQGRVAVGFFRSHLRPGPMQPSVADRTWMAELFDQSLYVFLLIQSRDPRTAAFFLAANGQLPDQPSVRKFFFDDSEFKFLPEVVGEEIEPRPSGIVRVEGGIQQRYRWLVVAGIVVLAILLIIGAFAGGISRFLRPASNKLDLAVSSDGGNVLKISWDHNAPFVTRAKGAVLSVVDGQSRREIRLGPDELKLGQVNYQHQAKRVYISIVLDSPDTSLPPQTFEWGGQ
jgi:proteasome lid subunit RPN8/RPN11